MDTSRLSDVDIYKLILEGKLKKFPDQFWTKPGTFDSAKEITQYFIEKILCWNEEDIKEKLTELVFRRNKLSGMLEYVFGRSPYKALDNAYPLKYKEWEIGHAPRKIWENESKREEAINWLLLKTNKSTLEELTNVDFNNYRLSGLLDYLYKIKGFESINKIKIQKNTTSNIRTLNIIFNKSGGSAGRGAVTPRLTLPVSWIKELGITEEFREVTAKLEDGKIIIEPKTK